MPAAKTVTTDLVGVDQPNTPALSHLLPEQLGAAAQRYWDVGVQGSTNTQQAYNTQRAYAADLRSYEAFCVKHQFTPYPIDLVTLTSYLTDLVDQKKKLATVHRHLAAIRKWHPLNHLPSAGGTPALNDVLHGIALKIGKEQRRAPPFTVDHLKSCIKQLDLSTAPGLRDRAILLMGFAGAFRRSELVALNIEDLTFRGEALVVRTGRSKTNHAGATEEKALFYAENSLFCPVTAYHDWVNQLGGRQKGPVFVSFHRGRKPGTGLPTEQRLSDKSVNGLVGKHLGEVEPGVPYTAHSFRASFIAIAKLAGQSNDNIRNQTNLKTDSVLSRYARPTNIILHNAGKALGL